MYDAILTFRSDDLAPRGPDVQMFLKSLRGFETNLYHGLPYGYRVMDHRWLDRCIKVGKECDRQMVRMLKLRVMRNGWAVDPEFAPEVFVRLELGEAWNRYRMGQTGEHLTGRHWSIAYACGWHQPVWK